MFLKYEVLRISHPNLAFSKIELDRDGTYPCLHITCVDEDLRTTPISIDLVPSKPLCDPITLPHHDFLPIPRTQLPYQNIKSQIKSLFSNERNTPKLFTDMEKFGTVYSPVENALIKALPAQVREGYRLAKAFRIVRII